LEINKKERYKAMALKIDSEKNQVNEEHKKEDIEKMIS
jgi:hypothetical protein